jgi:hypothetical protein
MSALCPDLPRSADKMQQQQQQQQQQSSPILHTGEEIAESKGRIVESRQRTAGIDRGAIERARQRQQAKVDSTGGGVGGVKGGGVSGGSNKQRPQQQPIQEITVPPKQRRKIKRANALPTGGCTQ